MKNFLLLFSLTASLLSADPVGIANPASVYCENQGGTLAIRNTALGQAGVCIFEDWVGGCGGHFWLHSECEEWSFFRGECQRMTCYQWFLGDNGESYCEIPINR